MCFVLVLVFEFVCVLNVSGCSACTPCARGQYVDAPCGGNTDNVCVACTLCSDGLYVNMSRGTATDTLCLACPNNLPPFAQYTGGFNVSVYACEWACTTSLVWRAESSSCECAQGVYYKVAENPANFDTRLKVYRPFGCVDCSVCSLGSFVAPVRVSKPCLVYDWTEHYTCWKLEFWC